MTAPQLGPSVSRLSTGDAFRLLKRRSPSVDLEMEGTAAATTGAAATGVWMTVSYEAKAGKRAGGWTGRRELGARRQRQRCSVQRPRPVRLSPRCSWSKRAIVRGRALSLVSLLARPRRRGCGNARMWRNRRIARPRSWCGHMAFISTSSEHVRKTWR